MIDLQKYGIAEPEKCVMVGDRKYDVERLIIFLFHVSRCCLDMDTGKNLKKQAVITLLRFRKR